MASSSAGAYYGTAWYYLPAALLVKSPLGALLLWLVGAALMLVVRRLRPAAPYVLVPVAVLLAVSLHESRNFGIRYAIFVPMFLTVAAAGVVLLRWRWMPVGHGRGRAVRRDQLAPRVPLLPGVLE